MIDINIKKALQRLEEEGFCEIPLDYFFDHCCEDLVGKDEAHLFSNQIPKNLSYIGIKNEQFHFRETPSSRYSSLFEIKQYPILYFKRVQSDVGSSCLLDIRNRGFRLIEPFFEEEIKKYKEKIYILHLQPE